MTIPGGNMVINKQLVINFDIPASQTELINTSSKLDQHLHGE